MDDTRAPTTHVLRPHHLALLAALTLTFKDDPRPLSSSVLLHLHRVLLNEIVEVAQPKPYRILLNEIFSGPSAVHAFVTALTKLCHQICTPDALTDFFSGLKALYDEKADEEPVLARRSLYGYFCRRCYVSFVKLSYTGVIQFLQDFHAWREGVDNAGYERVWRDRLSDDYLLFKTESDKGQWAEPDGFDAFQKAETVWDAQLATEHLRRFFEQHFNESNDSGLRQHAVLNLARMHYKWGSYTAARQYVQEAIAVARTNGDRVTLQHCMSLQRRFPTSQRSRKLPLSELQHDLPPLELLYDVKKLVIGEQPLSAAFEKIIQAVALFDHCGDVHGPPALKEQWAQHAVQSVVWRYAGCIQLAQIEENVVLAFTEAGSNDDARFRVVSNHAYHEARQGNYDQSLAFLLEPDVWRGLDMSQYVFWAGEIWHILLMQATRRGQRRHYRQFFQTNRPAIGFSPKQYLFERAESSGSYLEDSLYRVLLMRQTDQPASATEDVLTALWKAEFLGHFSLYRTGIILLADIGLEYGMTKWCRKLLEEIMPQMIKGDDLEQRALASFVLARCIIAGDSKEGGLREALPYLLRSEEDYAALEILRSLADVQYLLSVVYHNLDMINERDAAATRQIATEKQKDALDALGVDERTTDVWKLVTEIGAALAAR